MQKFLNLINSSFLFAGTTVRETEKMLTCLSAKQAEYQKNEYILRAGETNGYVMLLLEGVVCIVQEDFWGNRNIISKIAPGEIFAEAFERLRYDGNEIGCAFSRCKPNSQDLRRVLRVSRQGGSKPCGLPCAEKPAPDGKTYAYHTAYH